MIHSKGSPSSEESTPGSRVSLEPLDFFAERRKPRIGYGVGSARSSFNDVFARHSDQSALQEAIQCRVQRACSQRQPTLGEFRDGRNDGVTVSRFLGYRGKDEKGWLLKHATVIYRSSVYNKHFF